jgi:hypothetical protein
MLGAAGHAFPGRYWDGAVLSLQFFGKVPPGRPFPLDLWLPLSHGKGQLHINVPLRLRLCNWLSASALAYYEMVCIADRHRVCDPRGDSGHGH